MSKRILITGGHSGIGLELTKQLVKEGHHIGLIMRSEKRKEGLPDAIRNYDKLDYFFADLSDQKQVRSVAEEIKTSWDQIDILYNNAGVLLDGLYDSPQGNELHYEINTLAPYLLTSELRVLLEKSDAPTIISTSTGGMHSRKDFDVEEFIKPTSFKKLIGSYMLSKFAMTLLMFDMAKEWPTARIISVNPGLNQTNMTKGSGMPGFLKPLAGLLFPAASKGGTILYNAAFKEDFKGQTAIYIDEKKVKAMKYSLPSAQKARLLEGIKALS
ncbi:MAG: SDR family NAD(P)-dependent oxidoreductase [Bacteroidota bacterium]